MFNPNKYRKIQKLDEILHGGPGFDNPGLGESPTDKDISETTPEQKRTHSISTMTRKMEWELGTNAVFGRHEDDYNNRNVGCLDYAPGIPPMRRNNPITDNKPREIIGYFVDDLENNTESYERITNAKVTRTKKSKDNGK